MTEAPARPSGGEEVVRAIAVLLALAVVVVASWKVFDQVAAPSLFRIRQDHLAADYAEQRAGLERGQAAAVLQIPGIAANLIVVEGTTPSLLRGGPGHREGTPLPGEQGNSVIEGHRARWGAPFGDLTKLVPRTRIVAADRSQVPIEYRVVTVKKRVPRDELEAYLKPSKDARITLITHAGDAGSDDRLVIQAVAGTPKEGVAEGQVPTLDPPSGSPVVPLMGCVLAIAAAAFAIARLRRDHGRVALIVVVVPLVVVAAAALLMGIDETLSGLL